MNWHENEFPLQHNFSRYLNLMPKDFHETFPAYCSCSERRFRDPITSFVIELHHDMPH